MTKFTRLSLFLSLSSHEDDKNNLMLRVILRSTFAMTNLMFCVQKFKYTVRRRSIKIHVFCKVSSKTKRDQGRKVKNVLRLRWWPNSLSFSRVCFSYTKALSNSFKGSGFRDALFTKKEMRISLNVFNVPRCLFSVWCYGWTYVGLVNNVG